MVFKDGERLGYTAGGVDAGNLHVSWFDVLV